MTSITLRKLAKQIRGLEEKTRKYLHKTVDVVIMPAQGKDASGYVVKAEDIGIKTKSNSLYSKYYNVYHIDQYDELDEGFEEAMLKRIPGADYWLEPYPITIEYSKLLNALNALRTDKLDELPKEIY